MNENFMELKEQKIWLCWNFREKGGKKTKVPIAASGEKTGTDEAHSATWVTFDEAKRTAAARACISTASAILQKFRPRRKTAN